MNNQDTVGQMLAQARQEILKWQQVEQALMSVSEARAANPVSVKIPSEKPKSKRVGRGVLRSAILSSGAKKLSVREFNELLVKKGYSHPLKLESLRTSLENLVGEGIARHKSEDGIRYSVT